MAPSPAQSLDARERNLLNNEQISEPCTSVHLQLLLYFGALFNGFEAVCFLFSLYYKSHWVSDPVVYTFAVLGLVHCFFFEPFRYYLGFRGNLNEYVPHLFLFIVLSIFPSFCVLAALVWGAGSDALSEKSLCGTDKHVIHSVGTELVTVKIPVRKDI